METYLLVCEDQGLKLRKANLDVPKELLNPRFTPDLADKKLDFVCRMGDPDLIHCIVYRNSDAPGGVFCVHDKNGLLFAAVAESNLAFAMAEGFFGEMTANARYGVDVFENMEEPDD